MEEDGSGAQGASSGSDSEPEAMEADEGPSGSKKGRRSRPAAPMLMPTDKVFDLTDSQMPAGFDAVRDGILAISPAKQKGRAAEFAMGQFACLEMAARMDKLKRALKPNTDSLSVGLDVEALLRMLEAPSEQADGFQRLALNTLSRVVAGPASASQDTTARLLEAFNVLKPDTVQKKMEDALRLLDRLVIEAGAASLHELACHALSLRHKLYQTYQSKWLPLVDALGHKEAAAFLHRRDSVLDPISDATFDVVTELMAQKKYATVFADVLKQGQVAPQRAQPAGKTYADAAKAGASTAAAQGGSDGGSDKSTRGPRCFNCNEYGHKAGDCTKPKRKRKDSS